MYRVWLLSLHISLLASCSRHYTFTRRPNNNIVLTVATSTLNFKIQMLTSYNNKKNYILLIFYNKNNHFLEKNSVSDYKIKNTGG